MDLIDGVPEERETKMRAIGLSGHVIFPPKPIELTERQQLRK
jgi:hypothetical protein